MQPLIHQSTYKDLPSVVLSNGRLAATFLPSQGAKMASFLELGNRKEYLTQRDTPKYRVQPYDGDYLAGENSGFDDAFPTVSQCHYEFPPWRGTKLPDHGELWTLPFRWQKQADGLSFETHGVCLPYHFRKFVSFESENTLVLRYQLTNLSGFDMDFIWSGHIMLAVEEGGRIRVDPSLKTACITYTKSGRPGKYGDTFAYPDAPYGNGKTFKVDTIRSERENDILKFYFLEKASQGRFSLSYPRSARTIEFEFPPEQVPYVALMHNERGSADCWDCDYHNFFFEPCTAPFDRPDVARLHKAESVLKAGAQFAWYLKMKISEIAR